MKKLSIEEMKERIKKGYYITQYDDNDYELSHDTKKGYSGGVKITTERAMEWLNAGAELLQL